mgnify:CR=1 FL=1
MLGLQVIAAAQAILRNSRQVFLAADHSKFHRNAVVRQGNLSQINAFFTVGIISFAVQTVCAVWILDETPKWTYDSIAATAILVAPPESRHKDRFRSHLAEIVQVPDDDFSPLGKFIEKIKK